MNKSKQLGNNFYLLDGVIQHRFSTVYFDLKSMTGNITPQKWLLDGAIKLNN